MIPADDQLVAVLAKARRACQTCGNYHEVYETVYNRYHGGDPGSTDYEVERNWCDAQEMFLDCDEDGKPIDGRRCQLPHPEGRGLRCPCAPRLR